MLGLAHNARGRGTDGREDQTGRAARDEEANVPASAGRGWLRGRQRGPTHPTGERQSGRTPQPNKYPGTRHLETVKAHPSFPPLDHAIRTPHADPPGPIPIPFTVLPVCVLSFFRSVRFLCFRYSNAVRILFFSSLEFPSSLQNTGRYFLG